MLLLLATMNHSVVYNYMNTDIHAVWVWMITAIPAALCGF